MQGKIKGSKNNEYILLELNNRIKRYDNKCMWVRKGTCVVINIHRSLCCLGENKITNVYKILTNQEYLL